MKTKTILMAACLTLGVTTAKAQCSNPTNAVVSTDFIGTSNPNTLKLKVNLVSSGLIDNVNENAFFGYQSGFSTTTGTNNVAFGQNSLFSNTTGLNNVAIGNKALSSSTANENVGVGSLALVINTTGTNNTAVGFNALSTNTTSSFNTALGHNALKLSTGNGNTAAGAFTLINNSTGIRNSAFGNNALPSVTAGGNNTGVGNNTGGSITTGAKNTFVGNLANANGNYTNSTALGNGALVLASNMVVIGSNTIGMVIGGYANWSNLSDGRFKENVKENVPGLSFITKLNPVTYTFNLKKLDEHITQNMSASEKEERLAAEEKDYAKAQTKIQTGFIAQDVEKIANELGYNFDGVNAPQNPTDNYSIAYSQFIMPLVKAVQEQQVMIEEQKEMIIDLQKKLETSTNLNLPNGVDGFSVDQNIPNPFDGETVIKYNMPDQIKNATLIIYDLSGKQITSFQLNGRGESAITITSDKLAAGIYIYSVNADGKILDSKRMVVSQKQ